MDEKTREIIMARARLSDASLVIGHVYNRLFVTTEHHTALSHHDPKMDRLEKRMFRCFLEAGKLASELGDFEMPAPDSPTQGAPKP